MGNKEKELKALEEQLILIEGLPHLFGIKPYPWQKSFLDSTNRDCLVCAANQIGKSSIQIIKAIKLATEPEAWPKFWKSKPRAFWYLYPSLRLASDEFKEKWVKEFLPRNGFENHPQYGYKIDIRQKLVHSIDFNTGVTIYFKSYSQDAADLQAGTVAAIFCFTAGHKVITDKGDINIEDLKIGDKVLTMDGSYQRIIRTMSQEKEVITREFSNGEIITATPDHKFVTINRDAVEFSELNEEDILWTKNILNMMEKNGRDSQTRSIDEGITLEQPILIKNSIITKFFMSIFGKSSVVKSFQKAVSSTIKTLILPIMTSKIFSVFPLENIIQYIRHLSGKPENIKHTNAKGAELALTPNLLKKLHVSIAPRDVEKKPIEKERKTVYNITVENRHNYFINNFNVLNCDEELPYHLYGELQARLRSTRGYFHMVFTATLGQDVWRCAIEEKGKLETFRNAYKQQISMYDCQRYIDGTESQWTDERIREEINRCGTEIEVQRRIFGKFVVEGGLMYPSFVRKENVIPLHMTPKSWFVFAGIDIGSGGESGHPSAITFIAVSPDYQRARVIEVWRGDGIETDPSDVVKQYKKMKRKLGKPITNAYYDWASKSFEIVATRAHEPVIKAEKGHEIGEGILNTLFKNKMLKIYDTPDSKKLVNELVSLKVTTNKRTAKDDAVDSLRYACASIPWDFSIINGKKRISTKNTEILPNEREVFRAKQLAGLKPEQDINEQLDAITAEISDANDFYDN